MIMPPPSADGARPWFWGAATVTFLLALIAVFGAHGASARSIERALGARVAAALQEAGAGAVTVEMMGQSVRLSGAASSAQERAALVGVALTAVGRGGPWAGGVMRVDADDLIVGAPITPYTWRAVYAEGRVTLSGHAPNPRAARMLRDRAAAVFPNEEVRDEMRIAPGAPTPLWAPVAADALRALALLDSGEARVTDTQVVLLGAGAPARIGEVRELYRSAPPAPYRVRLEINPRGEGLSFSDLGDVELTEARADTCQDAFSRVMARNVINFPSGSAAIDPASRTLLDRLASIALRCDRFTIEIAGHTDNQGARAANMDLSRRRAVAVSDYLASQGVARERLRALGFGPDRPRASNASLAGQGANRRIEFRVSA